MTRLATNVWNNIPSGVEVGENCCGFGVGAAIGTGAGIVSHCALSDRPINENIYNEPCVQCCTAVGAATGTVAGPKDCLDAACGCPGEFCKVITRTGGKKKTRKQKKRRKTRKRKRKRTVKRKRKKRSIKKRRGKKRRKKTVKRTKFASLL